MRREPAGVAALVLAAAAVGHGLFSAAREGWTYDEPIHLQWSERFLDTGIAERASQERFNSKTPIMVPGVLARRAARAAGAREEAALRFAARVPTAVWLAGLLALVWVAGREIGPGVAPIAVALTALDPNLAAHGSLATADVPFACATLASLLAAHRLWLAPSWPRGLLLGTALGVAFVAKVSAVLLLPGIALLPLLAARPESRARPDPRRLRMSLVAAVAGAWLIVCAAYLFADVGRPLSALGLRSRLAVVAQAWPGLRLPVPAAFLTAFDASFVSERREWSVILLGRRFPHGVWYYFLVLWALKMPILVLVAEVAGLLRAATREAVRRHPLARLLAWNVLLLLAYFSLAFHAQIGYRYVLMAVPLATLLAAAGLSTLEWRRRVAVLAVVAALGAIAEQAPYAGNPLAFTNVFVQPKRLAYRWLADSNIDWGQNRARLAGWLAEREWTAARVEPVHILPGRNVLDLNALAGVFDFEQHRWVRENLEPRGHLGHTWLWYDVDGETFNRFLYESRRLLPDATAASLCPDALDYALRPADSETPFTVHRTPRPDETWVACVLARRDTDVVLHVRDGWIAAGVMQGPESCRAQAVQEGQEVWWRLDAGAHALCLVAQPNRRPSLPYDLEADWIVRGWGVRLNLRPLRPEPTPPPPEATSPRSSSPPRPRAG